MFDFLADLSDPDKSIQTRMPAAAVLVLVPPNMTVPASGPNGFLGDRIHQFPSVHAVCARSARVLLWPDDAVTRAFFSFPNIRFVKGQTALEACEAIREEKIEEVMCLYSPSRATPPEREADCRLLREAEAIVCGLPAAGVQQPGRLDPLGAVPVWRQLRDSFDFKTDPLPLPWFEPGADALSWTSDVVSDFHSRRETGPFLIISPFSGSPKKAVPDDWWVELVRSLPPFTVVVPVFGNAEMDKANRLFAGTGALVIEADLLQTIALSSLSASEVLGVDGGRLNLLAASQCRPVHAFFGIWPASAWALPNVQALPLDLTPAEAIQQIPSLYLISQ